MLKKSLIFGSVALFLAALITLTGCPTSADDDGSTTLVYGHRIYGWNVDPYQAQLAIDNAIKAGEPVVLEDNLLIQPGQLNFKNAQVRINGSVTFTNGVMNMTDATVSWAPGADLTFVGGGYYIHRESSAKEIEGKVFPKTAWVWFAESLEGIRPTATAAAVREFTLGAKQNHDYSRDSSGVNARVTAEDLDILFILDKLTIPSEATVPSGDFTIGALGTVDVTGNVTSSVVVGGDRLRLGTCSTLTSSRGATIPVPNGGAIEIPNVRVEAERNINLNPIGGTNTLKIPGRLTGPGTLGVGEAITDIEIEGGDGNLGISGAPTGGRLLKIGSTGRVAFTTQPVLIKDDSEISSDVVFGNTITNITAAGSLELYGNVTLENGQTITLTNSEAVILGAGKTITLQIVTQKTNRIISAPLLAAGDSPVVLVPAGATVFNTSASPKDDPEDIAEAKSIILGGASLEIADGTLRVLPEAILAIDTGTLSTRADGINAEFGYLTVADGGSVALPSTGSGGIDIGVTTIAAPFTFTAAGGAITLGNDRITGSAAGTKLAPAKGSTGAITVAGAITPLVLEALELDVAAYSSLMLAASGGKVALDKGAKLTLIAGENGQPTEWTNITLAGNTDAAARLTGAFVGLTDPAADVTKQPVWSVAHRGGDLAEVNIIATRPAVGFGKTPKATFTR